MGKNVFLINGHQAWEISPGKLNQSLIDIAREIFIDKGYEIKYTHIEDDYNVSEEVEKFLGADIIIFQTPVYWMSVPWGFKKYIDEVYMAGYGTMFADDGRINSDASKKYGSGGLLKGKRYMLSTTWNAPLEAFTDSEQFFEGKGVDGPFWAFHKAQEFVGLEQVPTFACYDVLKNPDIDNDFDRFKSHLKQVFDL
ncbi:MAG: NAD(P)H-dependent oxidoreductase [Thermodesulfobacteriota bacterium]|nr:NAD(P)H-dependent oxidoreductase [Thermodesulfobacteriota bacterium]